MSTSAPVPQPHPRVGTMARILGAAYWAIMSATAVAVILDGELRESRTIAVITLVISVVGLARAVMLGMSVTPRQFVFRSWFRTYRLDTGGISPFTVAPYAGMLNWYRDSPQFSMVVVAYRGRMFPLPYTSAKNLETARLVAGLNLRLAGA